MRCTTRKSGKRLSAHVSGPAISVPRRLADEGVRRLHAAGLLDGTREIQRGNEVVLPVLDVEGLEDWAKRLGGRLLAHADLMPREGRVTPREDVLARLANVLPPDVLAHVPEGWERHGDVLVLRLPPVLERHGETVARAFADSMQLKCVLEASGGIQGEFREMQARILWGDDPIATHVEGGVRYRFDASRLMFSAGNVHERMRVGRISMHGETVVDLFAGIGYFTLPAAVHARPDRIHALEKNPYAYRWLVENVKLNQVEAIVEPWHGDNREFPARGMADRVFMGYVGGHWQRGEGEPAWRGGTAPFLPAALALLKPAGGVVHYHDTAPAHLWREALPATVLEAAGAAGWTGRMEHARVVKTYGPGLVHGVVDVRLEPA